MFIARAFVVIALGLFSWAGVGCSNNDEPAEKQPNDASTICTTDAHCSDAVFCNGRERCDPEHPGADEQGCVTAARGPCSAGDLCNEDTASCGEVCGEDPDKDGDGHDSLACGGDDCDDNAANRYPGNTEICDAEHVDEDCDPNTLGDDEDGDGFVATECCNQLPDGDLSCGTDCDDAARGVNPGTPESCNEVDDDCDGVVDDGVTRLFFRDKDGDNFGVETKTKEACQRPEGFAFLPGDCNDEDAAVSPVAADFCDGIDSNCSSGGGEDLSEDFDGDGVPPASATHCIAFGLARDCFDHEPRAFPGQTERFSDPICPVGRKACACTRTLLCHPTTIEDVHKAFACIPEDDLCPAESAECYGSAYPDYTEASWDYNCDGESVRAPAAGDCSSQSNTNCGAASGYNYQDGCNALGCGESTSFIGCARIVSSCSSIIGTKAIACQ